MNIKINHATQKTQRQTQDPTKLYEFFAVNCVRGRGSTFAIYKTVLIIFPLNVQTSTKLQILSNGGEGRNIQ